MSHSGAEVAIELEPALRAALTKAWPTQQPIKLVDALLPGPSGKRRRWTVADQFLVDEAKKPTLTLQIIGSNFPNMEGTTREGKVEINGDELKYTTRAAYIVPGGSALNVFVRAK